MDILLDQYQKKGNIPVFGSYFVFDKHDEMG